MPKSLADMAIEAEEGGAPSLADLAIQAESKPSLADLAIQAEAQQSGEVFPKATPEETSKLQDDAEKIENATMRGTLARSYGQNLGKEATLLSTPGQTPYGERKVLEAAESNIPPIFSKNHTQLNSSQKEMLNRLSKFQEKKEPDHFKPVTSTLDALDWVFNMPNRVIAETVSAGSKRLSWLAQGGEGDLPEYHPLDAAMRSEKAPGVKYGGLDQTYQEAYQRAVGGRELTETERLALLGAGVIADIGIGGKVGQALAPYKRVPESQAIAGNIGKALEQGGFALKPADRAFTLLRKPQQLHPHVEYMGRVSAEGKSLPQRIQWAREELQKTAHSMGATPDEIVRMDKALLERIGPEGKFLGKQGWGADLGRKIQKTTPERMAEVLSPTEATMPFGSIRPPSKIKSLQSAWSWDRGAPQGVGDLVRQAQGMGISGIAQAEKDAKYLGEAFGTPGRGEGVAHWMDAYSNRSEANKWFSQAKQLEAQGGGAPNPTRLAARQEAIDRLDDLRDFAPKSKEEWDAVNFMKKKFDQFRAEEQQHIRDIGFIEDYLPRVETRASREKAFKIVGRNPLREGGGFTKERLPWDTGITLSGTPLHEFYGHPSAIYAARARAHHLAMTVAKSEADVLGQYGRLLPSKYTPEMRAQLKAQGVELYPAKFGANKDKVFLLDEHAKGLLQKTSNKEEIGKFWRNYDAAHGWLKGRMTVLRPGFVMRNFFGGNLYNMWLGDVDIMPNLNHASQVLGVQQARHFGKASPIESTVQKIFSTGMKGDSKVGGKSIDEWIKLMEENKVLSPGQVSYELGTATENTLHKPATFLQRINPMSGKNAWQAGIGGINRSVENLSKAAVFMDRIKKGYTAREAAEAVAKTLFNYDELSSVLGSQAVKRTMSFPIWQYKNMGLQFASMIARPDKFSQYLTARKGIQNLDPLDERDMVLASAIPDDMLRSEPFMMPRFTLPGSGMKFNQGPKGERRFFLEGGVTPIGSLGMSGLDKLARGKVKDFGEGVLVSLAELLSPVPGTIFKETVRKYTGQRPTMFGQVKQSSPEDTTWAPKPIAYLAEGIQRTMPGLWKQISDERQWIVPQVVPIGGQMKQVGYKIDQSFQNLLEMVDPGLSVLRRIFSSHPREEDYKTLRSIFAGYKDVDMTERKALRWQSGTLRKTGKMLDTEAKRQEEQGVKVRASNPFMGAQ